MDTKIPTHLSDLSSFKYKLLNLFSMVPVQLLVLVTYLVEFV